MAWTAELALLAMDESVSSDGHVKIEPPRGLPEAGWRGRRTNSTASASRERPALYRKKLAPLVGSSAADVLELLSAREAALFG